MLLTQNEIQGNIFKPFARTHAVYLFVKFREGVGTIGTLRNIIQRFVVSAAQQAAITEEWRGFRSDAVQHGRTLGCFGLTAKGYERLGLQEIVPTDEVLGSRFFTAGLSDPGYSTWQPHTEHWEQEYYPGKIDAFLLLQDDWLDRLNETVQAARNALMAIADGNIKEERGKRIMAAVDSRNAREHFGFTDDKTRGSDPRTILADHRVNSRFPGSAFGCYAAFMKIEENVKKFRDAAIALAGKSHGALTPQQAEERAVGRRKNGDPLPGIAVAPRTGDFTFTGVSQSVCPFHAHIRVMNMRDGSDPERIIRRGITYGPDPPVAGTPSGVLFLSLQRSISDFGILLGRARWNLDPLLSRSADWTWPKANGPENGDFQNGQWSQLWNVGGAAVRCPMNDMTTVRGGEFFFMPSITFLEDVLHA